MSDPPRLHRAAARGFESGADMYAAGRPDYPDALTDWLKATLGLRKGTRAVDLGAGGGKCLPYLLQTEADVIAVEPVAAMRSALVAAHPEVRVLDAQAERMPIADDSVDAVVCAQAFHWFANAQALTEIRRVLKPGGALGLIWNVRDESVAWVAALTRIIAPYEGDAPRFASGKWRACFPFPGFSALEEASFPHAHAGPPEQVVVNRTLSTSFVASLDPDTRARIAAEIRALIKSAPELAGRDAIAYPYLTRAFATRKS